ncbi:MAG TPA: BrnA antitoxin family protein [Paracoccaceae bacterium]|nr:BrnA antitoxin family protein [Paracoccaceae bacterium]HMO71919.1 BrnA antitoxin family protein [Paracoccaceae bacterium]
MDLKRTTAKSRTNYHYMADAMRRLEWDLHHHIEATSRIPTEWHDIARRRHPQPTERVTVRLDRDVVRFFRSMGAGYGPRINEVLRSYMHARLAGVLKGAETEDYFRRAEEVHEGERPMWGATGRELDGEAAPSAAEVQAERKARLREELHRRKADG